MEVQGQRLSVLFRAIEANRVALKVQDYSLSQTTLEDVFLKFAKVQDLHTNTHYVLVP